MERRQQWLRGTEPVARMHVESYRWAQESAEGPSERHGEHIDINCVASNLTSLERRPTRGQPGSMS